MASNAPEKFWYNIRTGDVERGMVSPGVDRVGPFDTENEAANALDLLRERSRKWEEEEREEN
jgi:hypothetical protein